MPNTPNATSPRNKALLRGLLTIILPEWCRWRDPSPNPESWNSSTSGMGGAKAAELIMPGMATAALRTRII